MAPRPDPARPICLLGLRCSGKTTVGRELARLLNREFVDLDEEVLRVARAGGEFESVGQVLEVLGLEAFRALESASLVRVLGGPHAQADGPLLAPGVAPILATGGGTSEDEGNRRLLARAHCVWLQAEPETLRARMRLDPTPRPSLTGADPLHEIEVLRQRREPWFRSLAYLALSTEDRTPAQLAEAVAAGLGDSDIGGSPA